MIELRGERLVVRENERGPLSRFDHLGHGEGFAGAGYAKQYLVLLAIENASAKLVDGGGLVSSRLVIDS